MLYKKIEDTIDSLPIKSISANRRKILRPLIDYVDDKKDRQQSIRINFICTHNSRKSHFSQVWAQAAAYHFNIKNICCYSGGTTATALFPTVIETLKADGFEISSLSDGDNPVFAIKYSENEYPVIGFSKKIDHKFNPQNKFAAVMTCSKADEACPFITGAENRIPVEYEDPGAWDDTPQQSRKYRKRSLQIATEMVYLFSQIKS